MWLESAALMLWLNFVKVVTILCFSLCFEHILDEVVNAVLLVVVWTEEYCEVLLPTLNGVSVHTSLLTKTSNIPVVIISTTNLFDTTYSFNFPPLALPHSTTAMQSSTRDVPPIHRPRIFVLFKTSINFLP
jgi:hypothetical protein